jgi:fermentation-respiration switch protein FrsA (DUF1100 family)
MENIVLLNRTIEANVLIISYRGYGNSTGYPSESGLMLDAEGTFNHIFTKLENIDRAKIFIFGRSLGGAVGIYAASLKRWDIKGIILENTFTSIPEMVDVLMPKIAWMKRLVL